MGSENKGWLGKAGRIIATIGGLVTGFGPAIAVATGEKGAAIVAKVQSEFEQIDGIVTTLQAIGEVQGLNGEQKLAAATPLVAQVVLQSLGAAGHKVEQPELFRQGCAEIASGRVKVMQSLHDKVEVQPV